MRVTCELHCVKSQEHGYELHVTHMRVACIPHVIMRLVTCEKCGIITCDFSKVTCNSHVTQT